MIAPKRKKVKEQGDKNKCITLAQKRTEKKKKEQTVSLEIEEEINDKCNLNAQFSSEQMSEQCTPIENCNLPSDAFIGDDNHQVPTTSLSLCSS
ncbi:hypothetical protein ACJMK2_017345 [Sinanodonta woodiana]|uniref:Uncharacterized protein n=1 Tax=Sinanodonta woodiana TaxID=1069815 RepID=A0ABD3UXL7_SINWO